MTIEANRKGQLFSGDIAIATVVFLTALSLALYLWDSTVDDINNAESMRDMARLGSEAIEQLVRTPGMPSDWNYATVEVPGLAQEDRVINATKAAYFIELMNATNYEENGYLMGIGPYQFYMNVTDLDGDPVMVGNTTFLTGLVPESDYESLSLFRTAIYNETVVRLNFIVWK
jgi:hypothetical protein